MATEARIRLRKAGGGDRFTIHITSGADTFDARTTVTSPITDKHGFQWTVTIKKVQSPQILLIQLDPVHPEKKHNRDSGDITIVTQSPPTNTPVTVDYVPD